MALTEIGARLRLAGAPAFKRDADRAAGGLDKLARQAGQADRKVGGLEKAAGKAGGALGKMGKAAAIGLAGLAAGAVAGGIVVMRDSIQHAADLGETLSKVNNVFGDSAGQIESWSKTAARSFGISQQEALAAAGQYGDMFKQLGFAEKAAVDNSKALVKMSADLGSFHNVDPTDVLDRIGAAMRGEYDSLQALIPNINAARVEQTALAKTGKKVAKELTAQEKVAATLAIIHKDGALAADDFAETSDGLTNQQRILSAQMKDTKASIGKGLLPVMTKLAEYANDEIVPAIQRFVDQFERGVGPGGEFKDTLADIGGALRDAWPDVKNVADKTMNFVQFLAKHPDALKTFAVGVGAYATAMKAASIWTAAMAAINLGKVATDVGAVGAASGKSAPKVAGFGAAARGAAGPVGLLAAALYGLEEAFGLYDRVGGGNLDKLFRAVKQGDKGGAWDALWGEGFGGEWQDWTAQGRLDQRALEKAKSPTPRPGGSALDRQTVLTPVTKSFPRKGQVGGNLTTSSASAAKAPLVVNVMMEKRQVGTAFIEDMEDRAARR